MSWELVLGLPELMTNSQKSRGVAQTLEVAEPEVPRPSFPRPAPPKPRAYWDPRLATSFYLAAGLRVLFIALVLHLRSGLGFMICRSLKLLSGTKTESRRACGLESVYAPVASCFVP